MLQAPNIAAAAGAELTEVILAEMPDEAASGDNPVQSGQPAPPSALEAEGYPIYARETGYVQYIDEEYVLTLAREQNLVIRVLHKPGDFVWRGAAVAQVWPAAQIDEPLDRQIQRTYRIGHRRTPTQDVEYAFNQLVEVAVRAMSPAINDPFTAMICLEYIGNGLTLFIQQGEKSPAVYDRDGKLRLIFEPVTFEALLNASFNMLRHCSCDNAEVLKYMLKMIEAIGLKTKSPEARQSLLRHVELIQAESKAGALIEQDRHLIQLSSDALQGTLKGNL
jgi:uncharacterized membrane protein